MADLTKNLSTPMSGVDAPAPARQGPSLFGGVLGAAGDAIKAFKGAETVMDGRERKAHQAFEMQRQRREDQRTELTFSQTQSDRAAENDSAAQMEALYAPVSSSDQNAVAAAQAAVEPLGFLQTAVDQGRSTTAEMQIRTDKALRTLFAQHPDSKAAIVNFFHSKGIDSPLTAPYVNQMEAEKAQNVADAGREEDAIKVAVQQMGANPNSPRSQLIQMGNATMTANAAAQRLAVRTTQMQADRTMSREDREQAKTDISNESFTQALNATGAQMNATLQNVFGLVNHPGIDPATREEGLNRFRTAYVASSDQFINNTLAKFSGSLKPEEYTRLKDQLHDFQKQGLDLLNRPKEEMESASRSLNFMRDNLKMDIFKAMPVYTRLVNTFGSAAVAEGVIKDMATGPQREAVQREINAFDPTNRQTAQVHYANLVSILRGETKLRDYAPAEATKLVPSLSNNLDHLMTNNEVLTGRDVNSHRAATTAYGAIADVALDASREWGVDRIRGLALRLGGEGQKSIIFNDNMPNRDARVSSADVAVPAMTHLLQTLKEMPVDSPYFKMVMKGSGWRIVPTGARPSSAGQDAMVGKLGGGAAALSPQGPPVIPPALQKKVDTMNYLLNTVVDLQRRGWDGSVPKSLNLTDAEARQLYGQGITPAKLQQKEAADAPGALKARWLGLVDQATRETADKINSTEFTPGAAPLPSSASGQDRVVNYEAKAKTGISHVPDTVQTIGQLVDWGKNLNNQGVRSSASGLFQITQSTYEEFAPKALGGSWRDAALTPDNQDKVAHQIFLDARAKGPDALRHRWTSLSSDQAKKLMDLPWEQARHIIMQGESA